MTGPSNHLDSSQLEPGQPTIGLLNPGAMGATVGACLVHANGSSTGRVIWAGDQRSAATHARAKRAGLVDVGTLSQLASTADMIISVCPPAAAESVAQSVRQAGFDGIFVDANAVSPGTVRRIATGFDRFVDGGIVGPPVSGPGTTRLYLAGQEAGPVAALFGGSDLEVRLVDGGAGAASAVKMCFAAWTKGTAALLLNIRALAESEGVSESLLGEWATSMPDLIARSEHTPALVGPKAWRFVGEMGEIGDSFEDVGLADGFHRAAAEVYARLAPLQGSQAATLDDVLALLNQSPE